MDNSGTQKAASFFRWTARIIGLPVMVSTFSLFTGENIHENIVPSSPLPLLNLPVTVPELISITFILLVISAYSISWWKERLGGILFISAYAFVVGLQILLSISNSFGSQVPGSWWIIWFWSGGSALLIVGILFLIAARLFKKKAFSQDSTGAAVDVQNKLS
jgi:hypothetical protein